MLCCCSPSKGSGTCASTWPLSSSGDSRRRSPATSPRGSRSCGPWACSFPRRRLSARLPRGARGSGSHRAGRPGSRAAGLRSSRAACGAGSTVARRAEGPRLAVLDDSTDEETRRALARVAVPDLWYAGRAEKRVFTARLADRGIPARCALVRALRRRPISARRTAPIATRSSSRPAARSSSPATTTSCSRRRRCRRRARGLAISSRAGPRGHPLLRRPRTAARRAAIRRRTAGPRSRRTRRFSAAMPASAPGRPPAPSSSRSSAATWRCGSSRRPHRVLLTASGLCGDSGLRGTWLLHLRDESWQRVTATPDEYEIARREPGDDPLRRAGDGLRMRLPRRPALRPGQPRAPAALLSGRPQRGRHLRADAANDCTSSALSAHVPIAVLHDPAASTGRDGRRTTAAPALVRGLPGAC